MLWLHCRHFCVMLLQVCLGAEAEDKFHMVEVEGLTFDGKTTKVPLAALKPSVLPSVSQKTALAVLYFIWMTAYSFNYKIYVKTVVLCMVHSMCFQKITYTCSMTKTSSNDKNVKLLCWCKWNLNIIFAYYLHYILLLITVKINER